MLLVKKYPTIPPAVNSVGVTRHHTYGDGPGVHQEQKKIRNGGVGSISCFKENHFGGSIFAPNFLAGSARVFTNTFHPISFWGTTLVETNPH
jgi:hypothetical protein